MPFTVEERTEINKQKKRVYVENCLDKKAEMLKTINRIKDVLGFPLERAVDEKNKKYKSLVDNVNAVAEKLEEVLNHEVIRDDDIAINSARDDKKIRNLLGITRHNYELENVALGENQLEDDEDANDITLSQVVAQFYEMMRRNNGDDFENVPYQQAGELLHLLENLKHVYGIYDDLSVDAANAVEYNMILKKIKEPEKYLSDFIKEKHKQLGDDFNYMKIDEFIEKQKQIYAQKAQEYKDKEKEIEELKEKDVEVLKLNQLGITLRDKLFEENKYASIDNITLGDVFMIQYNVTLIQCLRGDVNYEKKSICAGPCCLVSDGFPVGMRKERGRREA